MDNWGRRENYNGFVILYDNVDYEAFSEKIANEIVNNDPAATARLKLFSYKDLRLFGLNNNGTF